ncbi:hypothetical protein LAZ67_9002056, partial [Cordylochernes scorpioides]
MDKLKKACETKKRTLESVIAEADGELGKQEPSLEMLMSLRPKLLRCKDRFLIASDCLIEQLIKADREDEEIEDVDIVQANLFGRSEGVLQKMEQLLAKPTVDRESIVSGGNEGKSNLHRLPKLELPKFGGEAREWLQFWSAFQSVHDDDSISACVKLQYLQNCMIKGSVSEEIVSSFPNSAANYPLAISTLKERFGREDMLVEVYVRDLIAITLENAHGRNTTPFSTVYVRLSSQLRALGSLGVTTDKCAAILYPMVESALPEDLFVAWERTRHHHKPDEDGKHKSSEVLLEKLMEFLKHEVEGSERMRLARQPFSSSYPSQFNRDKPPKPKTSVATAASLVVADGKSNNAYKCVFCDEKHLSEQCCKAMSMSLEERRKIIKEKQCCYSCLKPGHFSKYCRNVVKCVICSKKHRAILCPVSKGSQNSDGIEERSKNINASVDMSNQVRCQDVLLQTIMVKIDGENKSKVVRAMLDSGSQNSYVLEQTASEVGLTMLGKKEVVHLLFGGVKSRPQQHKRYRIYISDVDSKYNCNFEVQDCSTICSAMPSAQPTEWMTELRSKGIDLDVYRSNTEIELLLGADVYAKLLTGKKIELESGPVALETKLGWTVSGKVFGNVQTTKSQSSVLSCLVRDATIQDLRRLDVISIMEPMKEKSKEELSVAALEHFNQTVKQNEDGRYSVNLPWIGEHPPLPNYKLISEKKLESTTALAGIKRDMNWSVFVAGRVKKIRQNSSITDWRHVPGKENPADIPSRGASISQLITTRWWERPVRLKKEEQFWTQSAEKESIEEVNSDSDKALYEFLDICNEGVQNLSTLGLERNTLVDLILIYIIQSKLDNSLKMDWELHIDVQGYPSYDELIAFLEKYARSFANLRLRETSKTSPKPNKVYSHATSVSLPNSNTACTPCMLCKNSHLLSKCQLFRDKSLQERWRFVRDNRLCYNCLRSNHLVYACKLTAVCGVCKLRHHTLLHAFTSESHDSNSLPGVIHAVESRNSNRVDSSVRSNVNSSACLNSVIQTHSINHSSSSSQILLSTALIRVNDLYGNSCMARALIDTRSQRTLITESLRKTLNLPVNYSDASMYGIGDNCLEKPLGEVDITFSPHYSNMLFTAKALILNKVTCNLPNFVMERSRWPHLVGLRLADPTFDKPAPIDIIIGADIAPSLYTGHVRFQNERGPTACNSKLGWLLSGKILAQQSNGSLHHSVLTFCATSIDNQLRKFWELDSIPSCTQPILTKEEMDCEQHFKTNVLRTTTGRYQVRLPFRVTPNFGNSKKVAFRRFLSLENKLLKSEQLYSRYKLFMKEYSSLNHLQIISAVDIPKSPSQVYYMPHHCVLKEESTTTNLRVVFDASACSDDSPSLNKALHIGPILQTDIFNLLLRFRTFFVALSADIEKMYRQILIHPDDSDYQRVLWRDKPSDAIQEYKLTTITYGTAFAPYLAIRTLHQLADDEAMNYPVASEIVKRDFYVDDLLTGADTVEEAQVLIRQIISLLAEGGFPIRKWVSNSPKILDFLPKDQKVINQSFDFMDLPSVNILGILWDPSLDSFTIRVKPPDIQVLSLPRLELCSALLLANLFVAVKESLSLHFDQIFLWSDSTIALNWIKSESKKWKTFVANRVSDIQRKTPSHSWFHVQGSENPADLATRGQTPAQLVDNQLWWQGPHWLQDSSVNSYIDLPPSDELSPETLIEERSTILVCHSIVGPMPELLLKYSSWIKTVDMMAFCLRFISNCGESPNDGRRCSKGQSRGRRPVGDDTDPVQTDQPSIEGQRRGGLRDEELEVALG